MKGITDLLADIESDARYLWEQLALLRYEVVAAVSWLESDAEPAVALSRLRNAERAVEVALRELADLYGARDSEGAPIDAIESAYSRALRPHDSQTTTQQKEEP